MTALDDYLEGRRALVEQALHAALPPEGQRPARLTEALRYSVLGGGKRLRPILCLAAAEAAGGRAEEALAAATAVELLHTYTLVHDDLPCMDDDALRRGQPTVHVRYGEALGVLVGDALQALAFETLLRGMARRPARAARAARELAAAAGAAGIVGGQVEDVATGAAGDEATVAFVHQHKTADLFRAAVRIGAVAGGATAPQTRRLGDYGNRLGLAFQIVDDLLDANDAAKADELSCLRLWTRDEARRRVAEHTSAAVAALQSLPGPLEPLRLLARHMQARVM